MSPANHYPLILASASPRRRELLARLGLSYTCLASLAEEHPEPPPAALIERLPPLPVELPLIAHPTLVAWRKAADISRQHPTAIVLAADTGVAIDGMVLGKPHDEAHAQMMIERLAGRVHTVLTGLCLLMPVSNGSAGFVYDHRRVLVDLVASWVHFHPLTSAEIATYVAKGESLDKAGGYGLQTSGATLVAAIEGSYTNVVGLPLMAVAQLLRAAGIEPTVDPEVAYREWLRSQGKEPAPWPTQP